MDTINRKPQEPQATTNRNPINPGLTLVYDDPEAKVDILLVHGLNGSPDKTWTTKKKHNEVFWPVDLLPKSLGQRHANVLVYGYNSSAYGKNPSPNSVYQHAKDLVAALALYRQDGNIERRPLIWVVHSLGGIVTKRALLYSNNTQEHRSIYVSTYAIIFLGTPHNGSSVAQLGSIIQNILHVVVPEIFLSTEKALLNTLRPDSEALLQLNEEFKEHYHRFKIHMASEGHKMEVMGKKIFIVDTLSAAPPLRDVISYTIEATHTDMCRFASENAPGYQNISRAIREWVAKAPAIIDLYWQAEDGIRRLQASAENAERSQRFPASAPLLPSQQQPLAQDGIESPLTLPPPIQHARSPSAPLFLTGTSQADANQHPVSQPQPLLPPLVDVSGRPEPQHEPPFIHPEIFRPNSYFVGREAELQHLHEMLMDSRLRAQCTSAVLIHCRPGGGKTHLAQQYVFQHREDYPGGVFWIRARSRRELEDDFARIARYESLPGGPLFRENDLPSKIVPVVKSWFSRRSGWLLVLDGVRFDMPGLRGFIPDARNTSLIYTSTDGSDVGDPQFDNPQRLKLESLTAQQAQQLLFLELAPNQPWSERDKIAASQLVSLMGNLPLMIHVAAGEIKKGDEPLERYYKSYKKQPKAGNLEAYKAVYKELENRGEDAALNLMSLVVYFGRKLPVEMLALGLSALDNTIPVKKSDNIHSRPSLNNTLKVLIAFGLLERSQSDDVSGTRSHSSKGSSTGGLNSGFGKNDDYLDSLHIHRVVQDFFIAFPKKKHRVRWLSRATDVWFRSYDEADRRIQEDSRVGLPGDYRWLRFHGQKLLQRLDAYKHTPTSLVNAKSKLEQTLKRLDGQIEDLSSSLQKGTTDGSNEEHPVSVFDRVSTSSQSASTRTDSHSSQPTDATSSGAEDRQLVQGPRSEQRPFTSPTLLASESSEDDDQYTDVLSVAGTQMYASITETGDAALLPPDPHASSEVNLHADWVDAIQPHRTLKRKEKGGYLGRVDARKYKKDSFPSVALNQRVADETISNKSKSWWQNWRWRFPFTSRSEAEMQLNKVKRSSPPSTAQGQLESIQVLPQVQNEPEAEALNALAIGASSSLAPALSDFSAAVMEDRRELMLPSDEQHTATPVPLQAQLLNLTGEGPIMPSAAYSDFPGNFSPFPLPSFSGLPSELLAHPGVRDHCVRWDSFDRDSDGMLIAKSGIERTTRLEPLSPPYPSTLADRQLYPSTTESLVQPAQLFMPGDPPAGESSQPMLRDGSRGSVPSISINSPLTAAAAPQPIDSRSPSPSPTDSVPLRYPADLPNQRPLSDRLSPPSLISDRRRSVQYTETEPSARLGTPPFEPADMPTKPWPEPDDRQNDFAAIGAAFLSATATGGLGIVPSAAIASSSTSTHSVNNADSAARWRNPFLGIRKRFRKGRDSNGSNNDKEPKGAERRSPSGSPATPADPFSPSPSSMPPPSRPLPSPQQPTLSTVMGPPPPPQIPGGRASVPVQNTTHRSRQLPCPQQQQQHQHQLTSQQRPFPTPSRTTASPILPGSAPAAIRTSHGRPITRPAAVRGGVVGGEAMARAASAGVMPAVARGGGSIGGGEAMARSVSAGGVPSVAPSGLYQPNISLGGRNVGVWGNRGTPVVGGAGVGVRIGAGVGGAVGEGAGGVRGGEAMARSASGGSTASVGAGGIRIGDGTVVEFGALGLGSSSPGLGSGVVIGDVEGGSGGARSRAGSCSSSRPRLRGLGVLDE